MRPIIGAMILTMILLTGQAYAAGSSTVNVSATILSNNSCRFTTNVANLNFGLLDPANPVDITVNASINFDCNGKDKQVTFIILDDDGLYDGGIINGNKMKNTNAALLPAQYIPYAFSYNPTSKTLPKASFKTPQPLTITGTILGVNYENVYEGIYTDTVVLTINP